MPPNQKIPHYCLHMDDEIDKHKGFKVLDRNESTLLLHIIQAHERSPTLAVYDEEDSISVTLRTSTHLSLTLSSFLIHPRKHHYKIT